MPALNHYKTICDIYTTLVYDFGKTANRPIIQHKVDNKYIGISFEQFKDYVEKLACGLYNLGIQKGDKIAILSENRPEWIFLDYACITTGIIDIPMYPINTADTVEFILNNSEAKAIAVSNKFQLNKILKIQDNLKYLKYIIIFNEKDKDESKSNLYSLSDIIKNGEKFYSENPNFVKEKISTITENDIATIIYTSGTTGEPKGVVLTHKNIISNVNATLQALYITPQDRILSFLPLCHIYERSTGYYACWGAGVEYYMAESIEKVQTNMVEVKPTVITTVPRLFERIYSRIQKNLEKQSPTKKKLFKWAVETGMAYKAAKKKDSVSLKLLAEYKLAKKLILDKIKNLTGGNLRYFVSGGAALAPDLAEFFEAFDILILEGYGLTETSPVIACNREDDYKFGTVGKIWPGVEVKIAPDGEILTKSDCVMQGYYKNPKETAEVLKDGWFHTGDIGEFDADGFLRITDRKKNLFKTSTGKYVAPTPIESLFLQCKYVDQFIIIGDKRMYLTAIVVPDFESLKEYADSNNIKYKDNSDLVNNDQIYKLLEKEFAGIQRNLANYEKIRRFTLLDRPLSIETGELTPTLKVKRKVIEEKYRPLIERMYEDSTQKDD
ncbi:MAG TPA: long-chain fatty acid--CoA ligase [Ignavibacteriales bacterium]|nr:long-chain fatty acid--CoA ligase [Ignavibacteriales bacterium]HPD67380.1 long-chain fatty acid--CoA ligase [Ignavibacteriales bacterium]HRR18777.1 long-chain fatty acid--CoA ligase [Ignavibacteriales bacterium]HRT99260.1 long-chain fatty acid--CoA ligase [Ignavibacteriales bacterium]